MDTFIGRLQTTFGKFTTSLSVASVVIAILSYLQVWYLGGFSLTSEVANIKPEMSWKNTWRYGSSDGSPKENARFTFDLDADLTPLFNWNTKQVFAYITVDYQTTSAKSGSEVENSLVIWDRIIKSREEANLHLSKLRSQYSVWDLKNSFGGTDRKIQFNLRWNIQPHVGLLTYGQTVVSGGEVQLNPPRVPQSPQRGSTAK